MFKHFVQFKRDSNLDYREAFNIFLELTKSAITGYALKKVEPYQDMCLPLIKAYLEKAKADPYYDHLGELYEEAVNEFGKVIHAQHFTPSHISKLMGQLSGLNHKATNKEVIRLNDPCCGFGSLPLGFLDVHEPYNKPVDIFLNDLDPNCCTAAFIQVTLACRLTKWAKTGFRILVTQGDILRFPHGEKIAYAYGFSQMELFEYQELINRK